MKPIKPFTTNCNCLILPNGIYLSSSYIYYNLYFVTINNFFYKSININSKIEKSFVWLKLSAIEASCIPFSGLIMNERTPTLTPTQKIKSGFLIFSFQKIGSSLVSFEIIFEPLQHDLFGIEFDLSQLKFKNPKNPEILKSPIRTGNTVLRNIMATLMIMRHFDHQLHM